MVPLFFAFDNHVVNIDVHISPDLFFEHFVHETLFGSPDVLETKEHYFVAINP